jgi:chromosome segregation ATPase
MGFITDLLKDIPLSAVLRERLAEADQKVSALEAQVRKLETESTQLRATVKQKDAEIERLLAQTQKQQTAGLAEIEKRILLMLASEGSIGEGDIAKRLGVGQHVADHHLEKLEDAQMIWAEKATYGVPLCWQLMRPGRDYLIEHGLLK